MTRSQSRAAARDILKIVPVVMRTVAAELRASGELPAPAHFGLLAMLSAQSRTLTELAALQGVSLPTMSNSISALVERGWVRRTAPVKDRRVVIIEVTTNGRATVARVSRSAEGHLAEILAPLDAEARRRLQSGLSVLRKVFAHGPNGRHPRPGRPGRPGKAGRTESREGSRTRDER
jgi:DNA-binding MarR family transcriptional regulator